MPAFHIDSDRPRRKRDRVGQQGDLPSLLEGGLDIEDFRVRFPGDDLGDQQYGRTVDLRDQSEEISDDPKDVHRIEVVQRLF